MENEKELTREELKGCISSYKKVIELQNNEIELLKKDNEFLSKKPEFNYRYQYENYKNYAEELQKENNQLKKDFKKLDNDYDNLLKKCKKLESANEGLHKEISDHKLDGQIIKSLQDDNKQLKAGIEKLQQNYDDLYDYVKGVERENKDLKELNENLYDNLKETEYKLKLIKREYNSSDINILQIEKKELLELLDKSKKEIEKLEQENKQISKKVNISPQMIKSIEYIVSLIDLFGKEKNKFADLINFLELRIHKNNNHQNYVEFLEVIRKLLEDVLYFSNAKKEQLEFELKLQKERPVINYEKLYNDLCEKYYPLDFKYNDLLSKYNELKSQYDIGLMQKIDCKTGVVMTKKYDNLNEKESLYRHILHKVASNNGFLVQTFKDYSNLQFCYDNFIKHGFEVQQVGSDTLIIRNK